MSDSTSRPTGEYANTRRWASVFLAAAIGVMGYQYARRVGPARHFQAGVEAFETGDLDGVFISAELLRGVGGFEPHLHMLDGMILLRSGQVVEALIEFGHARDCPDIQALAYTLSGEALYRSRQFGGAQRVLAIAVKLDPSQTDARRWLAALYYDIGAMTHAEAELKAVAEQAPADPRPHRLMGLIHKDLGQYDEAILSFREYLRRNPDPPNKHELLAELAECLVKERRHAEALETLRLCPKSAHVLTLQAECHDAQGDQATARQCLDEALELAPNHRDAMLRKAVMDLRSDDADSAVRILRQAVEHHPKDHRVRYQLVRAYQRRGQSELAQEQLDEMKELRELRERFSKLHEEAIKYPNNVETRYQLGVSACELDKHELAYSWFKATLAMDPNHAGARQALQAMLQRAPPPEGGATDPQ